MIGIYNVKIIETDKKIEVWKYSIPIHSGYSMNDFENGKSERRQHSELSMVEKANAFKRKSKYYREKRHEIRRLIEMNYKPNYMKFITLTFSEHITEVNESNYMFNKFIKRLKYKLKMPIQYVAVWERTKKNRIHYHIVIFNLKYIKASELEKIWGHGFIKINDVSHVESANIGRYIAKYFSKDLDIRDYKKKAFFTSRGLKKPKEKTLLRTDEEFENIVDFSTTSYFTTYKQLSKVDEEYVEGEVDYFIIEKHD